MHSKFSLILNAIGFNVCWFGLVIFGNSFILIAVAWLALHLLMNDNKRAELPLLLIVASIGIAVDVALTLTQVFTFSAASIVLPFWLITLWFCFAATLNYSLSFLNAHQVLQVFFGGLIAPLSYLAGAKFSAVELNNGLMVSYIILASIWALLLPLFFTVPQLIDRWLTSGSGAFNE